jgi:NitT/TauT family transport system substrate-binding protein
MFTIDAFDAQSALGRPRWLRATGLAGALALALCACAAPGASPTPPAQPKIAQVQPTTVAAPAKSTFPAAASNPTTSPLTTSSEIVPLTSPATRPTPPVTLKYGSCCSISWTQAVSDAKGFYADEGLNVEFTLLQASAVACQNLVAKAIDIASCSLNDTIQAIQAGANIVQIAAITYSASNYSMMAKPSIKSWADLKGKVIMVGGPQDNTVFFTRVMARANGVQDNQYDFQFAGASSARFAALKSGAVDASILTDPFDVQAEQDGFTRVDVMIPKYVTRETYSGGGPSVRPDWAKENADTVKHFLRAQLRAHQWINDPANKNALFEIISPIAKMGQPTFENTYKQNVTDLQQYSVDGRFSESGVTGVVDSLADLGFLKAPLPPATKFFDHTYLDEVRAGR